MWDKGKSPATSWVALRSSTAPQCNRGATPPPIPAPPIPAPWHERGVRLPCYDSTPLPTTSSPYPLTLAHLAPHRVVAPAVFFQRPAPRVTSSPTSTLSPNSSTRTFPLHLSPTLLVSAAPTPLSSSPFLTFSAIGCAFILGTTFRKRIVSHQRRGRGLPGFIGLG